ncbi:hypothetical protein B0H14DRAFT_1077262 [Mycena olivaceomarginata]|nr:hypothetical protein B0H14DRAFT_1077262 [Mycena olivaceomarginata]
MRRHSRISRIADVPFRRPHASRVRARPLEASMAAYARCGCTLAQWMRRQPHFWLRTTATQRPRNIFTSVVAPATSKHTMHAPRVNPRCGGLSPYLMSVRSCGAGTCAPTGTTSRFTSGPWMQAYSNRRAGHYTSGHRRTHLPYLLSCLPYPTHPGLSACTQVHSAPSLSCRIRLSLSAPTGVIRRLPMYHILSPSHALRARKSSSARPFLRSGARELGVHAARTGFSSARHRRWACARARAQRRWWCSVVGLRRALASSRSRSARGWCTCGAGTIWGVGEWDARRRRAGGRRTCLDVDTPSAVVSFVRTRLFSATWPTARSACPSGLRPRIWIPHLQHAASSFLSYLTRLAQARASPLPLPRTHLHVHGYRSAARCAGRGEAEAGGGGDGAKEEEGETWAGREKPEGEGMGIGRRRGCGCGWCQCRCGAERPEEEDRRGRG